MSLAPLLDSDHYGHPAILECGGLTPLFFPARLPLSLARFIESFVSICLGRGRNESAPRVPRSQPRRRRRRKQRITQRRKLPRFLLHAISLDHARYHLWQFLIARHGLQ